MSDYRQVFGFLIFMSGYFLLQIALAGIIFGLLVSWLYGLSTGEWSSLWLLVGIPLGLGLIPIGLRLVDRGLDLS